MKPILQTVQNTKDAKPEHFPKKHDVRQDEEGGAWVQDVSAKVPRSDHTGSWKGHEEFMFQAKWIRWLLKGSKQGAGVNFCFLKII